jgi:predicted nuclease of predicted toxin-antitoxin system
MKLLLDQGLARGAVQELARLGFDAVHASDIGMASATDEELLERARTERKTLITLDADFHALLALSNAASPSTVRVRIEGLRGEELATVIQRVVTSCGADLRAGAMVGATGGGASSGSRGRFGTATR